MELLAGDYQQKKNEITGEGEKQNMKYNRICVLDTETTDRY